METGESDIFARPDAGLSGGKEQCVSLRDHFDLRLLKSFFSGFVHHKYEVHQGVELLQQWHQQLLQKPLDDGEAFDVVVCKSDGASGTVLGGAAFRCYPKDNFVIVHAMAVRATQATPIARKVLRMVTRVASNRAVMHAHLAGCDAVFLVAEQSDENDDERREVEGVIDVCRSPLLLRALHFRIMDLRVPTPPSLPLLRGRVTVRIAAVLATTPVYPHDCGPVASMPYVPQEMAEYLADALWPPSARADMKYQMLIKEITVRQGVPLLSFRSAGWPERGPWIAVDLYDHFDGELMRRYFRDLMVPSIPNPDELEPLQDIYPRVEKGPEEDPEHIDYSETHLILLLDSELQIAGGALMEYWGASNCVLVTYLLVSPRRRRMGLASLLLKHVVRVGDQCAQRCCWFSGCNAVFLETNKLTVRNDVMPPAVRHRVFAKMGIRALDFDYVQPPLSDGQGKCYDLLLTVLVTPRIPHIALPPGRPAPKHDTSGELPPAGVSIPTAKEEAALAEGKHSVVPNLTPRGVPAKLVRDFMDVYWRTMVPAGFDYRRDPDFMAMMKQLSQLPYVRCQDLPWTRPPRARL